MLRFVRLCAIGLALLTLFSVLTLAVSSIPTSAIRHNIGASLEQIEAEGHPYHPLVGLWSFTPDNFTDAVTLNHALNPAETDPVNMAFGNYVRDISGQRHENQFMAIESLRAAYLGEGGSVVSYSRYWHGHQVIYRPLLAVLDLKAIRFMNATALFLLAIAAMVLVRHRIGLKAMIAFAVSLFSVGIFAVPLSIQFMAVFTVTFLGVVGVALAVDEHGEMKHDIEGFFVLGAMTSFADLLTAPLLSLGIPLALLLMKRLQSDPTRGMREHTCYTVKAASSWFAGYAGLWLMKWLLSSVVLGENIISAALEAATYRLIGSSGAPIVPGAAEAVVRNVAMLFPLFGLPETTEVRWAAVVVACSGPIAILAATVVILVRHRRRDSAIRHYLGLVPLACLPYFWFVIMGNHSAMHFWFTFRIQAITVLVAVFGLLHAFEPAYLSGLKARIVRFLPPRMSEPPA